MASNTKMPLKEEVLEKKGPEMRPDSPLLDLSDAAIKELILEQIAEREECATSRVGRSVDTVGAGNTPGQGS